MPCHDWHGMCPFPRFLGMLIWNGGGCRLGLVCGVSSLSHPSPFYSIIDRYILISIDIHRCIFEICCPLSSGEKPGSIFRFSKSRFLPSPWRKTISPLMWRPTFNCHISLFSVPVSYLHIFHHFTLHFPFIFNLSSLFFHIFRLFICPIECFIPLTVPVIADMPAPWQEAYLLKYWALYDAEMMLS
jgi:hypothetical protein